MHNFMHVKTRGRPKQVFFKFCPKIKPKLWSQTLTIAINVKNDSITRTARLRNIGKLLCIYARLNV